MSIATSTPKPLLTHEAVMQQVFAKTKGIVDHCYLDRDWVWYCGPSLQGEKNKPTRETLKEIGFRFSPGGHLMPDGKTRGSWGHACTRPTARRGFKQRRPVVIATGRRAAAAAPTLPAPSSLAELGL